METIKTSIKSEAVFSDDKKHRVSLFSEWNRNRPNALVIMIHPSISTEVQSDLTTVCILNNLSALEYGGVYINNLYSCVTDKIDYKFSPDEEILHKETDNYILKAAEKASIIVLAWGSCGDNNRRIRKRQIELMKKLMPYEHKVMAIQDNLGRRFLHPLTPQIRNSWNLVNVSIEKWLKDNPENKIAGIQDKSKKKANVKNTETTDKEETAVVTENADSVDSGNNEAEADTVNVEVEAIAS